jgi:DNA-binding transcriptional regulator YiaG
MTNETSHHGHETTTPCPTPSPADLESLRARLGLSVPGLAAYLGAPDPTLRKWMNGTRTPPAAVARLVEVLGLVEALAPAVHAALMPSRRRAGRPRGPRPAARAE